MPVGLLLLLVLAAAACAPGSDVRAQPSTMNTGHSRSETMDDQRVILITGSTGGLGRELALELAATGAYILVHGRNAERGREVVEQIESKAHPPGSSMWRPPRRRPSISKT